VLRKFAAASILAALAAGTASADTLREALVSAYNTNPTLAAQREALRATDANVAIARAAGRPQLSAQVGVNRDLTRSGILDTGASKGPTLNGGLDFSYPLFNGGGVRNAIEAAKTRVEAGRAILEAVEGDVFTEAVAAYMDVIRDRAIVELNRNQVQVLTTNLQASRDRFEIGDLTRTDVAQSEARLELARANLATAEARLAASVENYKRVIGHPPGELAPPDPLPPLPATAEEAVRIALVNNPDLVAIHHQAEAAGLDVRVARASRLPTVSGIASGNYVNALGGGGEDPFTGEAFPNSGTETSVGVSTRIPLYQGGEPAARIRQAQALEGQLLEQVVGTERAVVANTRSAFAAYEAARRAIQSSQLAVQANELALEGTRAERSVGTRNVLDVLNAEQELLNSQVTLVTARRDAYVAGFQLLNAMGQAQAEDLNLGGGALYDPLGNYRNVAGDWSDWAGDPRHVATSTRTVTPAEQPQGVTPPPQ
jgi:outer membrane protein